MQDLLEALVSYYEGNRQYAYQDLKELSENIKRNPIHMSERIMDAVRQDSIEHNLCPDCYNQLQSAKKIANIHSAKKIVNAQKEGIILDWEYAYLDFCPNCGWLQEDD